MPRSISTALDVLVTLLIHPPFSLQPLYVVLLDAEGNRVKSQLEQHSVPVFVSTMEALQIEPGCEHRATLYMPNVLHRTGQPTQRSPMSVLYAKTEYLIQRPMHAVQCAFCITCAGKLFTRRNTLIPCFGKCQYVREFQWKEMLRKRAEELVAGRKSVPHKTQAVDGQSSLSQNSSYDDYDTISLLSSSSEPEKDDISRDESGTVASVQPVSSVALSDSSRSPATTSPLSLLP